MQAQQSGRQLGASLITVAGAVVVVALLAWRHGVSDDSVAEPAARETVLLKAEVVDADTGESLPCRIHIEDAEGKYYAPAGHVELPKERIYNSNISHEPDLNNRGKGWALLEDGRFEASLPAADDLSIEIVRGLEYERPRLQIDLADAEGEVERTFTLKRGINMRERGWMSGDTHVHNLTPIGAVRQMDVEALDYVNLMFIGPGHPLLRQGMLTGEISEESTDTAIAYVSQEQRDAQQGHLTTLNMKEPIRPIQGYTGQELPEQEPRPHEPFNWEVWERLHEQTGLVFHAHYQYWPGYASPVSAALGKLDGVEFAVPDMVERGPKTRQDIEAPGHELTGAGQMWYHMLNCGARLPLCGGTDKMSASRVVGGGVRTYAKVDEPTHDGFIDALRRGRTFVTNGPLIEFTVDEQSPGSTVELTGAGPHTIHLKAECYTEKPILYFQIVKNGEVISDQPVKADEKRVEVAMDLVVEASCWLALRVGHRRYDPNNWENAVTAAHSSPVWMLIDGEPPAVRASAEYMIARMTTSLAWCKEEARYTTDARKAGAVEAYEQAMAFYQAALDRAP